VRIHDRAVAEGPLWHWGRGSGQETTGS
jgi:hypothetical protein